MRILAFTNAALLVLAAIAASSSGCSRASTNDRIIDGELATDKPPAVLTPNDRFKQAGQAAAKGDWESAESLLREHLLTQPTDTQLHFQLAAIAEQQNENDRAINLLQFVVEANPQTEITIYDRLARLMLTQARAIDTVQLYEQLTQRHPTVVEQRFALAGFASMLGLEKTVMDQLKWLAQHNQGEDEGLAVLAQPAQVEPDPEMCRKLLDRNPNDLRPHYGLAKMDAMNQRWDAVVDRLTPVVKKHPEFLEASALYGRGLAEASQSLDLQLENLERWAADVPDGIEEMPDYWLAAGVWADRQGNHESAARAFYEAAKHEDANNGETLNRLARSLRQVDRDAEAGRIEQRNQRLTQLHEATKTLYERETRSQTWAFNIADAMTSLGRPWEAEAWARLAMTLPDDHVPDAPARYLTIRKQLKPTTPWQSAAMIDELKDSLADLPHIDWSRADKDSRRIETKHQGNIRFSDAAKSCGLIHTMTFHSDFDNRGFSIFQGNGGGGAIIDFDLDGWPDIALANLNGWPMKDDSGTDRLFRNRNGHFDEVTGAAGFIDHGFSQGISSCDYNADGFPDLSVANIGRNRLFRNQGDGTWVDVTDQVRLSGERWTSSVAIADFDGDGFADIFETNYCAGQRPYEKECSSRTTGRLTSCTPLDFDAEADRVWAGRSDGTFEDKTSTWMANNDPNPGRGLGVLAANLDGLPGLEIFVANDMSANHLWSSSRDPGEFVMNEIATARGVALSGRSLSQASMGIAQGDPDHDGDLDLFVTHFFDDHNTFYEQISSGVWADRTHRVELAEPSMKQLGFGTQMVDFDNDGNLELFVANGHVGDLGRDDTPFQMPAQVFRLRTDLRWKILDRSKLGDYFTQDHVGRAVATLDANRDGLNDLLITQLIEPVALLINETHSTHDGASVGQSVGMTLIATQSHPDAVGATVHATIDDRMHNAQVTAGDGYMCSNQHRLPIGLAGASDITELTIDWPSGNRQTYREIAGGADYLFVEGQDEPFQLFEHVPHSPPVTQETITPE
ncbi:FG-GAP-like repeat-containing protein [Rubripirellula reticaptiva]|uniref:ASPIC and UnbV n=1 Tax=Rubripirellula reticaptiva TaxID=2528013 RepID=A0A5C6F802_9BACT|nr:FG-GAP-like repeat-containing protein [Rubripirellula reticaptiva]TWU57863.1 ASPIC and UnbV [Rubripirellula reticaptiva]